ncbi:hypothetical protein BX281_10056 [Streptomyces sp. Ag82_O1-15]|nr:hypothetical protein BX281_10056 [Streptomyces sp. Ag82_O1-15]
MPGSMNSANRTVTRDACREVCSGNLCPGAHFGQLSELSIEDNGTENSTRWGIAVSVCRR